MVHMTTGLLQGLRTYPARDIRLNKLSAVPAAEKQRVRRIRTARTSQTNADASELSEVGFGFSAGGLLFPYFIGVTASLHENGILSRDMKLAGSSAGSLISAFYHSGMSFDALMEGCLRVSDDCRANGTRGRLRTVLEGVVRDLLPEDAHEHCSGKAFVSITRLYPFRNELISDFESREDLICALLTSCHVPVWFDNQLLTRYKDCRCMDGGLTNLIPTPPVPRPIRISCFPMTGWGERYKVKIAPDRYRQSRYTVSEMVSMALEPAREDVLLELFEDGRRDAQDYVDQYTMPSLDEEEGRDFMLDHEDVPVTDTPTLYSRVRACFSNSKGDAPKEASTPS